MKMPTEGGSYVLKNGVWEKVASTEPAPLPQRPVPQPLESAPAEEAIGEPAPRHKQETNKAARSGRANKES